MQINFNINNYGCQEIKVYHFGSKEDKPKKQKQGNKSEQAKLAFDVNDVKEKFLPSKQKADQLEEIYISMREYQKAYQVKTCGSFLEFVSPYKDFREKKLKRLNSCKRRLCPFCAWRRSLRVFANIKKVVDEIEKEESNDNNDKNRFLLLTLTTKNVKLEELADEVQKILNGFRKLTLYKAFKEAYLGFVRALEVVVDRDKLITEDAYFNKRDYYKSRGLNVGDKNPNYLMCNVHIHCLLHTTYSRYSVAYISQSELVQLWKQALNLDYEPVVDIRKFRAKNKNTKGKELAEVAKYSVKPADYLGDNLEINKLIVAYLENALAGRRLLGLGGSFRQISRKLKLDYEELADQREAEKAEAEKYILQYFYSRKSRKYIQHQLAEN